MKVSPTEHPEVLLIELDVFRDGRGFFMETFHAEKFRQHGLPVAFVQDNHSRSAHGVLRGLHYQLEHPQGKLVRAATGEIYDVAVDIRKGSPNFGKWAGAVLSEENSHQLYIPPGFAHGYCVLSEQADFMYKCTGLYSPGDEYGIAWDDPDIGIQWPEMDYLLSDKDKNCPGLNDNQAKLPIYKAD
jgi:dTDP-4-dehydrorhamnose 3,5-epimerase